MNPNENKAYEYGKDRALEDKTAPISPFVDEYMNKVARAAYLEWTLIREGAI